MSFEYRFGSNYFFLMGGFIVELYLLWEPSWSTISSTMHRTPIRGWHVAYISKIVALLRGGFVHVYRYF